MKKPTFAVLCCGVLAAALTGCQTTHVKTNEWEASINSHWFKRDVDRLSITRDGNGGYTIDLNGYKGDTSEQLPVFTREVFSGLAVIGRLAAAAYNPAVASVPLTTEPATAENVAPVVTAAGDAKAKVAAAKRKLCDDGSCGSADCSTCTDGDCSVTR